MVRKESGGGLDYAAYIVGIFLTIVVAYMLIFYQKIVVVKEDMKNGLQICENYTLTAGQYYIADEDGEIPLERELNRANIVTYYDAEVDILTREEGLQVRELASVFAGQIRKQFNLNTHNVPENSTIAEMCAGRLLISHMDIYEAVYDENREIESFIRYTIHFSNNYFSSCSKATNIAPGTVVNGRALRGSMIFAELDYNIFGPNHVDGKTEKEVFTVSVGSSVDVVLQDNDIISP